MAGTAPLPHPIRAVVAMRPGVTQRSLAEQVGVTEIWLCSVISGRRRPSRRLKESLSAALGVPVEVLFRPDESVAS